jgi:hypothetical protein
MSRLAVARVPSGIESRRVKPGYCTSSRTLSFEGPDEAPHILVGVLGNSDILSFHHVGDIGELGFPEALEDSSVGVGVEHGGRGGLLAWHSILVGTIGSAWGHFQHVVPLGRQLTKAGHTEGQDRINDLVKRRDSRTVSGPVLSSGPGGPAKIVLLCFVEDTIDTIHPGGRDSRLGVDNVESRSDGLDKVVHVGGDRMSIAMEDVNEDGPGVKLLDGCLRRGWESHIRGCELLSIRKGQSGARLSYFGLLDHKLDGL